MRRAKESNSLKIKVMSASNRRKRLPTNVEDVVPCIQRVGSSGKRSYQTRGDKQGCSRADDIAASSVGRSPPSRTRPRPKNHQFCARPGAFTSIGSRLNLYCSAGRRRRGRAGHRSGSGSRGGKGARASRVVGTSSARARASPRANPRARSRGRTAPSRLVAFPRSDTLNLGWGALTVSWLRSLVHHLWVFVGCSQFFLLRA